MVDIDIPGRTYPTLPPPDVVAAIKQFAELADTIVPEKLKDDERIPQRGTWKGYPAWFRRVEGRLEVHLGSDALAIADDMLPPGDDRTGWRPVENVAPVPTQRSYLRVTEVNALRQAMIRACIALHNEWEPHLLTLEGGPALNPTAFLALMQATADYREATGE